MVLRLVFSVGVSSWVEWCCVARGSLSVCCGEFRGPRRVVGLVVLGLRWFSVGVSSWVEWWCIVGVRCRCAVVECGVSCRGSGVS